METGWRCWNAVFEGWRNTMQRRFDMKDQQDFARWSGDCNPIHMSPLAARRTQVGRPLVHGIHSLLWVLDSLCSEGHVDFKRLRVQFPSPVYLGDLVEIQPVKRSDTGLRVQAVVDGTVVLSINLSFALGEEPPLLASGPDHPADWPRTPLDLNLEGMALQHGAIQFAVPAAEVGRAFPALAAHYGAECAAALAAGSRVIGMICPGLHSILSSIDLNLTDHAGKDLTYSAVSVDERFRTVDVGVVSGGVAGTIQAFARVPPVQQVSTCEIATSIDPKSFAGEIALVVGGSRGIGEVTAKHLAAGGAEVIVTYQTGRDDAERVVSDITAAGFKATAHKLDINSEMEFSISTLTSSPTHVYYFATSPIFGRRTRVYDPNIFDKFQEFYVDGFNNIVMALLQRPGCTSLTVFYPSSIAVEERPKDMTEYAMAKAAGEHLCRDLARSLPNLRIFVERLPRVLTDQTATVRAAKSENASETVMKILHLVHPIR